MIDPLGCEAEEFQGEMRMFGETRAEARPRHDDKDGLCQRHGGPHVGGFLDQPQVAKRLPESKYAKREFLTAGGAGIDPDVAAEYHVAGGARSAGGDQDGVFLTDFDPPISVKQFDGGGRELRRRRMFIDWPQELCPRGCSQSGTWLYAVSSILPDLILESVTHSETLSRQNTVYTKTPDREKDRPIDRRQPDFSLQKCLLVPANCLRSTMVALQIRFSCVVVLLGA